MGKTSSGHAASHTTQRPFVVGVAGPSGAGKSTLIEGLTAWLRRLYPRARISIRHPRAGSTVARTTEENLDVVFIEADANARGGDGFDALRVDTVVLVVAPHHIDDARWKTNALFARADWIVLNKSDDPRTATAKTKLAAKLKRNRDPQAFHLTVATQPNDLGVAALCGAIAERAGFDVEGGEKPCQLQIDDAR